MTTPVRFSQSPIQRIPKCSSISVAALAAITTVIIGGFVTTVFAQTDNAKLHI